MPQIISTRNIKQQGFVLIVALMLLVIVTILVVNGLRSTNLNEKMAGSYMDRNRANQAAEQAIRQGIALLQANAESCLSGCTNNDIAGIGPVVTGTNLPSAWEDQYAVQAAPVNGQTNSAKYLINLLPDSQLPTDKADCKAYSIMGRGQGVDVRAVVILQTTTFLCPI